MSVRRFPRFMELPAELRLFVWKELCEEPRTIKILASSWSFPAMLPFNDHESPTPSPVVLCICREAREEGLKHYTKVFKRSMFNASTLRDNTIYMNLEKDTVYLTVRRNDPNRSFTNGETLVHSLMQEAIENHGVAMKMRRVAIPTIPDRSLFYHLVKLGRLLGLREAIFVIGQRFLRRGGGVKLVDLDIPPGGQALWNAAVDMARIKVAQHFPAAVTRVPPLVTLMGLQQS
ncbi:hypothetical protein N431DRAFT_483771 [Stipitochalara longipes BDJ]|nr:hypothetical protein N431DRAFT_483771 [Stipitochalara longipes BDJ]